MLKPKKRLGSHKEIKQDKLVTYYFQAQDIFEKHKKAIIYGLLAIVTFIVISNYSQSVSFNKEQEASVKLAQGKAAYESAQYQEATTVLGPLTSQYGGTKSAEFGTILLAKSFLALEQYNEAEQYYRAYLKDYDDDILSLAAYTGLANCYDQKGEYDKAAKAYEEAANVDAKSFQAPELLLAAARCYQLVNDGANAKRVLQFILERYPKSQSISTAKLMLAELSS